jgi:hypothetical protein
MNNANTTHTYMNNNDTERERFAINASKKIEFLLGGLLAKARGYNQKNKRRKKDKEQVSLAHGTEECFLCK